MKLKSLSLLVIGGGILFSLFLQGQVADGVYFSGDGGLKALLAKQLASGELRFDLAIPDLPWVQELWNAGLYPYDEPYVYQVADKYYITFPYTFPLVTAPFYALFGYRGLYIVPLVSCWVIWLVFYWDCLRLKLNDWVSAVGLICLIFGSYLTIYSAMYWEHTLAVALSFSGLSLWFLSHKNGKYSLIKTIFSGILIGLAVWFRPEFVCVVIIMMGLAFVAITYPWWRNFFEAKQIQPILFSLLQQLVLIISMISTVIGFFVTNKIIYGYAVGIHGIQVVESVAISDRLIGAWSNFTGMSLALVEYFPVILFPLFYLALYLFQKLFFRQYNLKFSILETLAYLAIISFIIGVSLLVPVGTSGLISGGKQWGVRFLLMVIPVVTMLIIVQLQQLVKYKISKYVAIFLLVFLGVISINKNVVHSTQVLTKNNQVTAPAVEYLKSDPNQYIAISHEFAGQTLEAATIDREIFFTIDTVPELLNFSQELIEEKQNEFTYICYPHRACNLPKALPKDLQFTNNNKQYQIQFKKQANLGKYPIYQGTIISK